MRYISDDVKVFNTEMECSEYENVLRKKHDEENQKREEERLKKEKLEKERQKRFELIKKHHNELNEEIQSYQRDYGCILPVTPIDFVLRELFK